MQPDQHADTHPEVLVSRTAVRLFSPRRMRELRKRRRLTQEQLAIQAGVSSSIVSHWEAGAAAPAGPTFVRLAAALNVEPIELTTLDAEALRLADLRHLAGLTQAGIGSLLGLSAAGYAAIERGGREPRMQHQDALAAVFKVPPAEVRAAWERSRHARR